MKPADLRDIANAQARLDADKRNTKRPALAAKGKPDCKYCMGPMRPGGHEWDVFDAVTGAPMKVYAHDKCYRADCDD